MIQVIGFVLMMTNTDGGPIQPLNVEPEFTKFASLNECERAADDLKSASPSRQFQYVKYLCLPDFVRR